MVVSCKSTGINSSSYADDKSINRCDCNSVKTDSSVICFSAVGESRDEMFSKEKALSDARVGLASLLETKVLAVSNKFKESEKGISEEISEIREEAVRQVVNQVLSGIRIGCENVLKTQEGYYKTYIRLEVKEQAIIKTAGEYGLLKSI